MTRLDFHTHREREITRLMDLYELQGVEINEAEKRAEREYEERFQRGEYDGEYYD